MNIVKLFIKKQRGSPLYPCDRIQLKRGYGAEDDINAGVGNPRQVLLASAPVLEEFGLTPGALRENILVDGEIEAFTSGQVIQLGDHALIRLMELCEPCAYLNTLQPGLAKHLQKKRGYLGMVVRDGVVHVGEAIALTPHQFPAFPTTTREKFEGFLTRVPAGKVVRFADVLYGLGLSRGYSRAIATFLKKSPHLPIHRIIASDGSLRLTQIPDQAERLQAEGVEVKGDRSKEGTPTYHVPSLYYWDPQQFYDLGSWTK